MRRKAVGAWLAVALGLGITTPAWAGELSASLTQAEVVRAALANHLKIAQAEAQVQQARHQLDAARRWFRPQLSLSAGERLDQDGHRVGVQVSQDLDALWDRSRVHEAQAMLIESEQALELVRQTVVTEAVAAHDAWVLAQLERWRNERRRDRAREALQRAQQQYDDGLISAARFAELEQMLEDAERSVTEASLRLGQATLRVRQAMGELGTP